MTTDKISDRRVGAQVKTTNPRWWRNPIRWLRREVRIVEDPSVSFVGFGQRSEVQVHGGLASSWVKKSKVRALLDEVSRRWHGEVVYQAWLRATAELAVAFGPDNAHPKMARLFTHRGAPSPLILRGRGEAFDTRVVLQSLHEQVKEWADTAAGAAEWEAGKGQGAEESTEERSLHYLQRAFADRLWGDKAEEEKGGEEGGEENDQTAVSK